MGRKQIVKFSPNSKDTQLLNEPPTSATKHVPEWYKKVPLTIDKEPFKVSNRASNLTIKACTPILDAFTAGYMVTLGAAVQVRKVDGDTQFFWNSYEDVVERLDDKLYTGFAVPPGFDPKLSKFLGKWKAEVPPGYSVLLTHPLNRPDLPFYSLSAIVDIDKFPYFEVTFFLRDGFEGIIEAGTPIAQFIPFKRESWESEVLPHNPDYLDIRTSIDRYVRNAYKKTMWSRKSYT